MLVLNINGQQRLIKGFEEAIKRVGSARPVLNDIGDKITEETDLNFRESGARLNSRPWKELKSSTLKQKIRMGYGNKGILERTGDLRKGFEKTVTNKMVKVSNKVKYYRYHQLGMRPQPKRKMLAFNDRLVQELVAQFTKYINDSFR